MLWSRKEKKYLIIFDKYCPIPRFLIATTVYVIFSHLFDHLSEVQIKGVFNGNFRIIYCDFSIATCCGYSLESSCIVGNHCNHLVTRTHYKYYLYGKLKRITIKNPFHPITLNYLSPVMRKPVFGVCNQGRLKLVCTATEARWYRGLKFWIQQV